MARLEGKRRLVTGGPVGIGFATAQRSLEESAEVIVTARNQDSADAAAWRFVSGAIGIGADSKVAQAALTLNIPAGRFGTTREIADLVVDLGSDESAYTVGQDIIADGSRHVL